MATSSTKPKTETQYDAIIETYLSRYDDRPIVGYAIACDEIMTGITRHIIHDALTYDSSNSKTYVAELRTLESCIKQMKRSLVPAEFAKVEKHYEQNKSKRDSETSLANRVLHPQYAVSDVDLGVDDDDIFVPMDTTERDGKVDAFCSSMSYVDGKGRSAVVMPDGAVLDESDVTDIDDVDSGNSDDDNDAVNTSDVDSEQHGEPQQLSLDDEHSWFREQTYVDVSDDACDEAASDIVDDATDDDEGRFVPCDGQMSIDFGGDTDVDACDDNYVDGNEADENRPTFMTPSGSDFKMMDVSDIAPDVADSSDADAEADDNSDAENAGNAQDDDSHIARLEHLDDEADASDNAEEPDDTNAYEDCDVPETHHSRSDLGSALAAMASVKGFDVRTHKLPVDVNGEPILVNDNVWRIDSGKLGKVTAIRIDGNVEVEFQFYTMSMHGSQLTHTNPHKPKPNRDDDDLKIPMTGAVSVPDGKGDGDAEDDAGDEAVVDVINDEAENQPVSNATDDTCDDGVQATGDSDEVDVRAADDAKDENDVESDDYEAGSDDDGNDDEAADDKAYDGPRGIDGFPYTVVSCDENGNILYESEIPEPYQNYALNRHIGTPLVHRKARHHESGKSDGVVKPWSDVSPFVDANKMGRVAPKVDVPEDVVDRMIERLESRVGGSIYSETYLGLPISEDNPVGGFDAASAKTDVGGDSGKLNA